MSKAADALRAISGGISLGKGTETPSIPTVPRTDDPRLNQFMSAVKQIIETREGERGNSLDSTVTWRKLIEKQFAIVDGDQSSDNIIPSWFDQSGANPWSDGEAMTIPPSPTGFEGDGAFANIILSWDDPPYSNHAYTEIWRSSENNLGTAQLVGMAAGSVYTDSVGGSASYYYWIKFVSTAAIKGPFNATEGLFAKTSPDPAFLLQTLAGQLNDSQLNKDLSTKVELIGTNAADIIEINTITEDSGSASARALAQVQARLDTGDYAAVKIESSATASAVDGIEAKYSVKTDVNGYVSGFGLISTANNATPFSQFIFKADQFGFGAPGLSSAYPFVIQATPTTINGVAVPAGVYIDAAYITNGSITSAKIGNAAIDNAKIANLDAGKITTGTLSADRISANSITGDKIAANTVTANKIDSRGLSIKDASGNIILAAGTDLDISYINGLGSLATLNSVTTTYIANAAVGTLQIGGNAVTVPSTASASGTIGATTSSQTVLTTSITMAQAGYIYASVTAWQGYSALTATTHQLWVGSNEVANLYTGNDFATAIALSGGVYVAAGTYTISYRYYAAASGSVAVADRSMFVMGAKR